MAWWERENKGHWGVTKIHYVQVRNCQVTKFVDKVIK